MSVISFILQRYLVSSRLAKKAKLAAPIGVGLPMAGVATGVAFFVIVLSVMSGFVGGLKNRLLGFDSHIEIVHKRGFGHLKADESLLKELAVFDKEITGVSPFVKGDVIVHSAKKPTTVVLVGLDPIRSKKTTDYEKYLLVSRNLEILSQTTTINSDDSVIPLRSVFIGRELSSQLNIDIGDRATLLSITGQEGPAGLAPSQFPVGVADIFLTNSTIHDSKLVLTDVKLAQEFFDMEGLWSGIQINVKDPFAMEKLVEKLDKKLDPLGLRTKTWMESNKSLLRALKLERWGMRFVLSMVILVGCFSITITLVLAIKRKNKEMAILRSLGLSKNKLGLLFLATGTAVGTLGSLLGFVAGLASLYYLKSYPLPFLALTQSGKPLPVLIEWNEIGIVAIGSIILAAIAAVWPAIEVMRIDVIDTLSDRTL